MDRFERALSVASEQLKDEFGADLVGLLFAGSAAYGTPMPNSDVDLYVLIQPNWRQRRNRVIEGVEVEMFINPVSQIRRELDKENAATVNMFALGHVTHDPTGVVAQLVERAKRIAAKPTESPDDTQLYFIRYNPSDLVRDVEDLLEIDLVAAEMLLSVALQTVLEAYWQIRGQSPPKPKHLLKALRAEAPALAQDAAEIVDAGDDLAGRVRRLRELCELILEPVGGLMLEGETPPEHLPATD